MELNVSGKGRIFKRIPKNNKVTTVVCILLKITIATLLLY